MLRNFRFAHAAAAAALLGLSWLAAAPARAGSYTYNTEERKINAGILILQDPASTPPDLPNYDPYPFFILNQRADVKPAGWSIVNPRAPSVVDSTIITRWDAAAKKIPTDPYGAVGGKHVYDLGAPVTQNMAPYWEVSLDASVTIDDLRQYNILMLDVRNGMLNYTNNGGKPGVRFTAHQKEMLRQYVDGGGQLLIESTGGDYSVTDLFFDVAFMSGTFQQANLPGLGGPFRHPILNEPNILSQNELLSLGHSADLGLTRFGVVADVFAASPDPYGLLGPVLINQNNDPVVEAGQLGAGEVIVDTTASCHSINGFLGGYDTSGSGNAPNSGPFCNSAAGGAIASGVSSTFSLAPIADMKFLVNVISWSGVHNSESGNAHQNAASTDVMESAVVPTWSAAAANPLPGTYTAPVAPLYTAGSPGSAIYGHYVAVVDKAGVLHVYDLIPSEDLDSDGNPDDGIPDYRNGTSYDELWRSAPLGSFASAPTIATIPKDSEPSVFVEAADGSVSSYTLTTGVATPNVIIAAGASYTTGNAPAPTYYNGRLFAGRADGTVAIHDFVSRQTPTFRLVPDQSPQFVSGAPQPVTASPAVAMNWLNGDTGQVDSNDLVLYVTTTRFVYTIFTATYNETLFSAGATGTYNTKIGNSSPPASIDSTPPPSWRAFTLDANNYENFVASTVSGAQFTIGPPYPATLGVDYYATMGLGLSEGLARTVIGTSAQENSYSSAAFGTAAAPVYVSAPAVDKNGYAYVTVTDPTLDDSAIECVQDSISGANRRIRWRFKLPSATDAGYVDAAGIDYSKLLGYHFIGAPVVDRNGFVYALAADKTTVNGLTGTAILCFDTNQTVTADLFGLNGTVTGTVAGYTITQPGSTSGVSEFGLAALPIIQGLQFNGGPNGHIDFTNFASPPHAGAVSGQYPSLCEPQPIQVSYTLYDGTNNIPVGPVSIPLNTNMKWCVYNTTTSPVSAGLTLVGDYVFFGDTGGNVYRVGTQLSTGLVQRLSRFIDGAKIPFYQDQNGHKIWQSQPSGLDGIDSLPAAGSGSLIVNGYNLDASKTHAFPAVGALQNKKTLVLDADRLVEMDANGDLIWGVDSTSKAMVAGGDLNTTGTGANGATGKVVIAHSDFNHPASINQLDQNNYLIADTGNNRCVEMDRSGKVVWELTSFRDPGNLLANSGQPTSLNHPTSIQAQRFYDKTGTFTYVKYLIADSGNHRIVEVTDVFDPKGVTIVGTNDHTLTWVSHTYDKLGRKYNFAGADYFYGPDQLPYIVGLISNYSVGQLPSSTSGSALSAVVGTQASESADSPGGSIVMLDYQAPGAAPAPGIASGFIHVDQVGPNFRLRTYSDFDAYLQTGATDAGKYDVKAATIAAAGGTLGASVNNTISLKSPRFLHTYVTKNGGPPIVNFLITDRNGAFDLQLVDKAGVFGNNLGFDRPVAKWGFTNADYSQMMTPMKSGDISFDRGKIAFGPSSIQIAGRDLVNFGGTNYPVSEYLIASSTAQGDAAAGGSAFTIGDDQLPTPKLLPRIGGEVFTIAYPSYFTGSVNSPTIPYTNAYWNKFTPTFSRPSNSGPLVQPMAALLPL